MAETKSTKRGNPKWAKGVSGNPGGRPKAATDFRNLAREHGEAALKVLAAIINDEMSKPGDRISAAAIIIDRGYGKCSSEAAVLAEDKEIPQELLDMDDVSLAKALIAAKGMQ